ncbi:MAG: N-acetylmuramoyl-L-alanine amidase [Candidatus Aenigmarchaeota archaeon]|nr:N-acetylmuramoyl-L-alanine amidase [Candidatus Aenigmarchaeota archaeon]
MIMKNNDNTNSYFFSGNSHDTNSCSENQNSHDRKGLASLEILITTFFVLAMLFILGAMAMNNIVKQEEIAILQKDVLYVKNEFSLFNRSLDSTWSLSTVQALYKASENGFEPSVYGNSLSVSNYYTKGYWYRFHPEKEYTGIKLPSGTGADSVPNRCSNDNPGICLPQPANVENAVKKAMEAEWFMLSDSAPYTVLNNPVKITIPAKENNQDNSLTSSSYNNKLDINAIDFWPGADKVVYQIATRVVIEGYKTKMDSYAVSKGYIKTGIGKMVKAGWLAVGISTQLRYYFDAVGDEFKYTEDTAGYSKLESYLRRYFQVNGYDLADVAKRNGFVADLDTEVGFKVPASNGPGHGLKQGAGLLMRYETAVSIVDDCENVVGISALQKYREYESYISRYSSQYDLSEYSDSPQALVAGIITIESSWNPGSQNPSTGARGLMQIMANTAPECNPDDYDDMLDPEKNIRCGIIALKNKITRMKSYVNTQQAGYDKNSLTVSSYDSSGDLLRMALAAYNWGEGNVQELVSKYGKRNSNLLRKSYDTNSYPASQDSQNTQQADYNSKNPLGFSYNTYSDIENYLPDSVRKYVTDVMAGYNTWQSCSGSGKPAVIDVTNTIPSTNFAKERSGKIDSIVMHDTAPCDSALKTYQTEGAKISAHYLICADGRIYQLVNDEDRAYHAPPFNDRSIGIEHESTSQGWTDAMMTASSQLTRWLADRYGIEKTHPITSNINNGGIIGHDQISDYASYSAKNKRTDPNNFDWNRYIEMINKGSGISLKESAVDVVKDIEDYRKFIEQKTGTVASLENNYCEERDDSVIGNTESPRGNSHLAYDIVYHSSFARVVSAYDGEVVFAANSAPSYLGSCAGIVMVKSKIGKNEIIIAYSNVIPASILLIGKEISKGDIIGTVSPECRRYGSSYPYLELRIFKASFKVPKQEDSVNLCGKKTNCWEQGGGEAGKDISIESYIGKSYVPYWCSAIKWEKGMLYHESVNPVRGKNLRYYENSNEFKQEAFKIKFFMEDWFPVLDCTKGEARYQWQSPNDMLCYNSKIYTCERGISGLADSQKLKRKQIIGPYKCLAIVSGTAYRTGFMKTASDGPESQTGGRDNFYCLASDPGKSKWVNLNSGFCIGDGYCSEEEKITYGSEACQYTADCC